MKLVTVATVSDRLKVTGSLARKGINDLVSRGLLRCVSYHSKTPVYTRATNTE